MDQTPRYQRFRKSTNIVFYDVSLLDQAFVHRSYVNELPEGESMHDNERLEFLGDAVLGFITSELLYARFPDEQEGVLTRLRSYLVRRHTLSRVAKSLHFGEYLRLGRGEEESGGRERPATLCATFEAVLGAIFLDQGIDAAREFVIKVLGPELEMVQAYSTFKDPKSRFQEYIQDLYDKTPRYRTEATNGPDHNKEFIQKVYVDGKAVGLGRGRNKQDAEQAAAAMALMRLEQPAPEYDEDDELEMADDLVTSAELEYLRKK